MKNIRLALKRGDKLLGSWISTASPIVCELMAASGFDFLALDVEHSAVDLVQAQALFQAIKSGNPNCAPFVRLHGVDYALTKRYLDAGARGIIGPLVNSPAEARLLVEACKYPPLGKRGVGFCRANGYGRALQPEFEKANEEILVAVQIEHMEAVNNIEAILSVPGIDAAFIGPYDLSASMGLTGQFDHPSFLAARERILKACREHQVVPGIHVIQPNPKELVQRADEGYALLAYSLDITMLMAASTNAVETFRSRAFPNALL
jgi:2-dehydro-3-deoxyglucarate aldolase